MFLGGSLRKFDVLDSLCVWVYKDVGARKNSRIGKMKIWEDGGGLGEKLIIDRHFK